jgi:hypothetical protein
VQDEVLRLLLETRESGKLNELLEEEDEIFAKEFNLSRDGTSEVRHGDDLSL